MRTYSLNLRLTTAAAGAMGGLAASFAALAMFPSLARHIGGSGSWSIISLAIAPAGAAIGGLLALLIHWAGERSPKKLISGAMAPWISITFLPLLLLLPAGRLGVQISPFGPVKYDFAITWIAGIMIHAGFLLPAAARARNPLRFGLAAAAIVFLISFSTAHQPPSESDEGDYIAAALAMIDHHSLRVDLATSSGAVKDFYFGISPPSWMYYTWYLDNGYPVNKYSLRLIGYPALIAPFVAISREVELPFLRWWLLYLPNIAAFGLLAGAIEACRIRANCNSLIASSLMISIVSFIYYASNSQPEIWLAAGAIWTALAATKANESQSAARNAMIIAASTTILHERMFVTAALTLAGLLLFSKNSRRPTTIAWIAAILAVTAISFAFALQLEIPLSGIHAYAKTKEAHGAIEWIRSGFRQLFSPSYGLIFYAPFSLIAVCGLGRTTKKETLCFGGAFLGYFLMIVTYPDNGESWPHARYLVPAMALLAPFTIAGVSRLNESRTGRIATRAILALQLAAAIPLLSAPQAWRYLVR